MRVGGQFDYFGVGDGSVGICAVPTAPCWISAVVIAPSAILRRADGGVGDLRVCDGGVGNFGGRHGEVLYLGSD